MRSFGLAKSGRWFKVLECVNFLHHAAVDMPVSVEQRVR